MAEQRQLVLAERVVERAAAYEEKLGAAGKYHSSEAPAQFHQLTKEYYTLRITLVQNALLHASPTVLNGRLVGMATRASRSCGSLARKARIWRRLRSFCYG